MFKVAPFAPAAAAAPTQTSCAGLKLKLKANAFSSPCASKVTSTDPASPRPSVAALRLNWRGLDCDLRPTDEPAVVTTAGVSLVGPPTLATGSRPAAYRPAWTQSLTVKAPSPRVL